MNMENTKPCCLITIFYVTVTQKSKSRIQIPQNVVTLSGHSHHSFHYFSYPSIIISTQLTEGDFQDSSDYKDSQEA